MKLLVISHTVHHWAGDRLVGWGPTVREMDHLASLFEELVHVAPVHAGPAPQSALPYERPNVRVVPVTPAGGTGGRAKLGIVRALPQYVTTIRRELRRCDVVHVRCPSNIGLVALAILAFTRPSKPRWVKYAGNWHPDEPESWSYSLQRWLLRSGHLHALVTVNGDWSDAPAHVRAFLNPCLTGEELREGAELGSAKELSSPLRLLFVGRLEDAKGSGRTLEILGNLRRLGVSAEADLVGDGPERARFEAEARAAGLAEVVRFHGWLPRPELGKLYARAHFILLPSTCSEGWPKVLSEGMAYGAVPLTSNVSSMPGYLDRFETGHHLDAFDVGGYAGLLRDYAAGKRNWKADSRNALRAAGSFSYTAYLGAVRELLSL